VSIFKPNLFPYKYPNILNPSHSSHLPAYEDGTDKVLRKVKFRCWGITQKKAYNIRNKAKVWNQGYCLFPPHHLKIEDGANKQQLSLCFMLLWCGILPLMLHNSTAYYISLSLFYFSVVKILCICLNCWGHECRSFITEQNIGISILEKGILSLSSSSSSSYPLCHHHYNCNSHCTKLSFQFRCTFTEVTSECPWKTVMYRNGSEGGMECWNECLPQCHNFHFPTNNNNSMAEVHTCYVRTVLGPLSLAYWNDMW
jgi:hypothetical protein